MSKNIYKPEKAELLKITRHTPQEWSFLLAYPTEEAPGKFLMVSLPGAGEVPISISGFKNEGVELTIRNVGQVTSRLFELKEGDSFFARGPYGRLFPLDQFALRHLLIIAGGSGVAAVKSVIEYFLKGNECRLKKLDLLFGFRSPRQVLFREEIMAWRNWGDKCEAVLTVDTHEKENEEWQGKIGFVTEHIGEFKGLDKETQVIVVGPPLMMNNTIKKLKIYNIKKDNIWLSFERHMKCGVGKCGHCRIRDKYVCLDGPVFSYPEAQELVD